MGYLREGNLCEIRAVDWHEGSCSRTKVDDHLADELHIEFLNATEPVKERQGLQAGAFLPALPDRAGHDGFTCTLSNGPVYEDVWCAFDMAFLPLQLLHTHDAMVAAAAEVSHDDNGIEE